ncbi:tape measure protein [Nocardioides ochotonae]|uniref:tape measure protein n=1 Tax=Nocardioides ochotonae TaxID=2685869 RepID=UPI0017482E05|nr:tape measure protein [Nocardioides ochotonae]
MAIELGAAYISILPSTNKLASGVRSELSSIGKQGLGAGQTLGAGLLKGAKAAVGVAGLAATVVGGAALKGGISRLLDIEDAQAKLRGLGHDGKSIQKIMDSALGSVKGTAFGLGEAATTAAGAVAAGIEPGKELTNYLMAVADAATIAGVPMAEMGSILNKTTTQGRAYTMELNQLADRGIPIFQWLADEYGVTSDALREMVADGKVDAATFRKVITKNIGGAALESGETTRGAYKNMMAALGRIGANFLEGAGFGQAKDVFKGLTDLMAPIEGTAARIGTAVGTHVNGAVDKVKASLADGGGVDCLASSGRLPRSGPPWATPGASCRRSCRPWDPNCLPPWATASKIADIWTTKFAPALADLIPIVTPIAQFFLKVFGSAVIGVINGIIQGFGGLMTVVAGVVSVISGLLHGDFSKAWQGIKDIVKGAINFVIGLIRVWWNIGIINIFKKGALKLLGSWKGAWTALKKVPGLALKLAGKAVSLAIRLLWHILKNGVKNIGKIWKGMGKLLSKVTKAIWNGIKNLFVKAWEGIKFYIKAGLLKLKDLWNKGLSKIKDVASNIWDKIKSGVTGMFDKVRSAFSNGVEAIRNIWNGIKDAARKPVEFVVNTVWNNGLRKVINAIPGVGDLPTITFARGGYTGPGAKFAPAGIVHADEFVIRKEARRRFERDFPGALDYLNRYGTLPGLAGGGLLSSIRDFGSKVFGTDKDDKKDKKGGRLKKWLGVITKLKDLISGFDLSGLTGAWGDLIRPAIQSLANSAVAYVNRLIPDWGPIPDNPIPQIFDNGGILEPGALAFNASRKPEAVFNHRQFAAFAEANNARPRRVELVVGDRRFDAYMREVAEDTYHGETAYAGTTRRMMR